MIATLINSIAFSSLLILVVTGLAVIYGLRGVMNFAHGALYMAGAYLGYTIAQVANFWVALIAVPIVMGLVGFPIEFGVFRPLRKLSPMNLALLTFGAALIISDVILRIFGSAAYTANLAGTGLEGTVDLWGQRYPVYRLFVIVVGIVFSLALFLWLRFSRSGMYVRAVSQDPQTSAMTGINADRIGMWIVCLGTGCAGLAGVLAAPYVAVLPTMGAQMATIALIIVVLGGVGSIGGAILMAVIYGFVTTFGAQFLPEFAAVVPFLVAFLILVIRPQGLGRSRTT